MLRAAAIAGFLVPLAAGTAGAHGLEVFATAAGGTVEGYVYYDGGTPARNLAVSVLDPNGEELSTVRTGEDGRFTYQPVHAADHRFVAETDDGHRATYTIRAGELSRSGRSAIRPAEPPAAEPQAVPTPAAAPPAFDDAALAQVVDASVARQLVPLREQLAGLEQQRRLQDVLGGMGYLVGLAGLVHFVKARSRARRA